MERKYILLMCNSNMFVLLITSSFLNSVTLDKGILLQGVDTVKSSLILSRLPAFLHGSRGKDNTQWIGQVFDFAKLNYLFGLVCQHRVIFIVIFSDLFCCGISFECQLFGLDCYQMGHPPLMSPLHPSLPVRLSICCTPYFRNCTSCGHYFW